MSGFPPPKHRDHVPPDPRGILTSIGIAIYDWDILGDRLTWAPNAADVIDRDSSRPDLGILCYPVITMRKAFTHEGSRKNLLGDRAEDDPLIAELSNDERVTGGTPPTFLFHTADDDRVLVENTLQYAAALRANRVPFALHIYEHGRHGVGLATDDPQLVGWSETLITWLRGHGW